jgi:hypothetical protein
MIYKSSMKLTHVNKRWFTIILGVLLLASACAQHKVDRTPTLPGMEIPTPTFISLACLEPGYPGTIHYANSDSYGDGYISRVPIKDVAEKNYDEIVPILATKWLEHYKTQSSVASASIENYEVQEIQLIDPSCDPFFKIVARVKFSVVPSQVPHDMASFPGEEIKEEDPWWHLWMPVGVFIDGEDYRLRIVFGYGT